MGGMDRAASTRSSGEEGPLGQRRQGDRFNRNVTLGKRYRGRLQARVVVVVVTVGVVVVVVVMVVAVVGGGW